MNAFTLKDLEEALKHPAVRLSKQTVEGVDVQIVSYMVSTPDLWDIPGAIECRGIVFDMDGNCICRPFEKFWNVGERASTQIEVLEELWDPNYAGPRARIEEKLDGSMLTPVLIGDKLRWKTKKSFYSDVALEAQSVADLDEELTRFCKDICRQGYTPIFEYCSPTTRVVISHEKPSFHLLAVRHNATGRYETEIAGQGIVKVPTEPVAGRTLREIVHEVRMRENTEGVILILNNGSRVKVKTDWYLKQHRVLDVRWRDIADLVVAEQLDDVMLKLQEGNADMNKVRQIAERVALEIGELEQEVLDAAEAARHLYDTDRGACYKFLYEKFGSEIAGMAMRELAGREWNVKAQWKARFRSGYPLTSLCSHWNQK